MDSVVETFDCLIVCSLLVSKFSNWPAPSSIQRGLEWTQLLKRLFVLCLCVIKFSNFSLFQPSLFIQYSTEECSTVQLFIYKIIAVMIDIDPS